MKKSHETIETLTADVARNLAKNVIANREDYTVKQIVSFFEDEIRESANLGLFEAELVDLPTDDTINVEVLDKALEEIRSRGFQVEDDSTVDELDRQFINDVQVRIRWDKPVKGKKK